MLSFFLALLCVGFTHLTFKAYAEDGETPDHTCNFTSKNNYTCPTCGNVQRSLLNFSDDLKALLDKFFPDAENKGYYTQAEILSVTEINCANKEIVSLKGIERLVNLERLDCSGNEISSLSMPNLTKLKYLSASNNANLSINAIVETNNFTYFTELEYLYVDNCNLLNLNLTACTKLKEVTCNNNLIETLNLSNMPDLVRVETKNNRLTQISLFSNASLTTFSADQQIFYYYSDTLSLSIEGARVSNLSGATLSADQMELTEGQTVRYTYTVAGNSMNVQFIPHKHTFVDDVCTGTLGGETACGAVRITENLFPDYYFRETHVKAVKGSRDGILTRQELDSVMSFTFSSFVKNAIGIEHFSKLDQLNISQSFVISDTLTKEDPYGASYHGSTATHQFDATSLKGLNSLTYLNISNVDVGTSIDFSQMPNLQTLYAVRSSLTSLDLSNNPRMVYLCVYYGSLGPNGGLLSLDVTGCTEMETLYCWDQRLTTIDVSDCTKLGQLAIMQNNIPFLDEEILQLPTSVYYNSGQKIYFDIDDTLLTVDLKTVYGTDRLSKLSITTSASSAEYDSSTGILTFPSLDTVKNLSFTYTVGTNAIGKEATVYGSFIFTPYAHTHSASFKNHDSTQHWEECGTCHTPIAEKEDHYGTAATCLQRGYCTYCAIEYGDVGAHVFEESGTRYEHTQTDCSCTLCHRLHVCTGNFPDEDFSDFVYKTLQNAEVVTVEELLAVTELNISSNYDVLDFEGIALFENLERLVYDTSSNRTYAACNLDLSQNVRLQYLQISNVPIYGGALDLSQNTALLEVYADNCALTQVAVSDFSQAVFPPNEDGDMLSVLLGDCIMLSFSGNQLTQLPNVSGSTRLYLDVSQNQITGDVVVSQNVAVLMCSENGITSISAANCPYLIALICDVNPLGADASDGNQLDISGAPNLMALTCTACGLTTLDVSNAPNLVMLRCDNNNLTALDVSSSKGLCTLSCISNQISALTLPDFWTVDPLFAMFCNESVYIAGDYIEPGMPCVALNLDGNRLTEVPDTPVTEPVTLDLREWGYEPGEDEDESSYLIEFPYMPFLITMDGNLLTGNVDISGEIQILAFSCNSNTLTSLELPPYIMAVICMDCGLTELDVTGCSDLLMLYCAYNQIEVLDLSNCANLQVVYCGYNRLTSLDFSNHTPLYRLDCSYNQLTSLNVAGCTQLYNLYCNDNQLTTLNVDDCEWLYNLNCDNNHLTRVDLSNNVRLSSFSGLGQTRAISVSGNTLTLEEVLVLLECSQADLERMMTHTPALTNIQPNETFTVWTISDFPATIQYRYMAYGSHTGEDDACCAMSITLTITNQSGSVEISATVSVQNGKNFSAFTGGNSVAVESNGAWSALLTLCNGANGENISVDFGQALPDDTKLTLVWLDRTDGKAKFYYYAVTGTSVRTVAFSDFTAMGASNSFDFTAVGKTTERFILIVDYSNASTSANASRSVSFAFVQNSVERALCTSSVTVKAVEENATLRVDGETLTLTLPKNTAHEAQQVAIVVEATPAETATEDRAHLPYDAAPTLSVDGQSDVTGVITGGNRMVFVLGDYKALTEQSFTLRNLPEGYTYAYSVILLTDAERYNASKVIATSQSG